MIAGGGNQYDCHILNTLACNNMDPNNTSTIEILCSIFLSIPKSWQVLAKFVKLPVVCHPITVEEGKGVVWKIGKALI